MLKNKNVEKLFGNIDVAQNGNLLFIARIIIYEAIVQKNEEIKLQKLLQLLNIKRPALLLVKDIDEFLQNKAIIDSWMLSERTYEPEKSFYSYGKAFDPFGVIDANTGRPIENPLFQNDRMIYTKQMYQEYSWLFGPKKK